MHKKLVIIPTYNEIENIEAIIKKVVSLDGNFEILIVDDGSPDGTALKVKELQKSHESRIHIEERKGKLGLGTAYIHGFKWGLERKYDYIFEMDADFSHNPDDLIRLYNACAIDGNDVAIGSRYINGVNVVNWPIGRVLMSYGAGIYVRKVLGIQVMDPTGGFMCYSRKVLERLDLNKVRFVGYAFQIEMKYNVILRKFKMVEVPIIFTDRTAGTSKMSSKIFREAIFGVMTMKVWSWFWKDNNA